MQTVTHALDLFGLLIEAVRGRPAARVVLALSVAGNLALLGAFKYANFAVDNLNLLREVSLQ